MKPPETRCYDAYRLQLASSSSTPSSSSVSPILLPRITDLDRQTLQVQHEFNDLEINTVYSVGILASNVNGESNEAPSDLSIGRGFVLFFFIN